MVKVGDIIETEFKDKGEIINIEKIYEGRHRITYLKKSNGKMKLIPTVDTFLEGDTDFKVMK